MHKIENCEVIGCRLCLLEALEGHHAPLAELKTDLPDLPVEVSKELERLHSLLSDTGQQEHRKWAIAKIEHIHRLYFSGYINLRK